MWNLLNALVIFGMEIPWSMEEALFWLLVAQVALILFMIIVFAILIRRMRDEAPVVQIPEPERKLLSLTLDFSLVRRKFALGADFECGGLVVTANYNTDPVAEVVTDFTVVSAEALKNGEGLGELLDCVVIAPDMSEPGKKSVTVNYHGKAAVYMVAIGEEYDDDVRHVFVPAGPGERALIGITLDTGVVRREFEVGDEFECEGLIVTAHFNAAPFTEPVETFTVVVPDMSEEGKKAVTVAYEDQTASYAVSVLPAKEEQPAEETEEEPVRELVGITLETGIVRREFEVGDEFECEGLIVTANYSAAPFTEPVESFTIVVPDMSEEGKKAVTVNYENMSASYAISVVPVREREAEPVVVMEEPAARTLIALTLETGIVRREFTVGEEFECEGLVVTANYSAEPYTEQVEDYEIAVPDMSEEGKPTVTITYGGKSAAYAISVVAPSPERELVGITLDTEVVRREFTVGDEFECNGLVVTANYSAEPFSEHVEDYEVIAPDMSEEGKPFVTVVYKEKTAVYAVNVSLPAPEPTVIEEQPDVIYVKAEPVVVEEESFRGTLRYNKSFTARLIQSDDDLKHWYTEVKNELLSYKKAKARMSWKKEIFRIGRDTVARFGFRGKTLCIFFPLNPIEFEGTKYKLEDVSDNSSFSETPCMFRLKNARRVKYAIELIALIAANLGAPRIERESEDFFMPYEGIVELINKGLIKRNVKNASDEAIFRKTEEAAPAETEIAPGLIIKVKKEGEKSAETPAEEVAVAEAPAEATAAPEEAPAEVAEPIPYTELPEETAAEQPVEEPAEEPAPVEEPTPIEEPVEESVEEQPAEETVEEPAPYEEPLPILEPTGVEEPMPYDGPVAEAEPVAAEAVEEPAPYETAEEAAEEPVEEQPAEEPTPVEEQPVEEPVEETAELAEEPLPILEPTGVEEPMPYDGPVAEAEPVAAEAVEEPAPYEAAEEAVDEPIPYTELPEETAEEQPVEEPVEEQPVEEPVEEQPVEEPVEEQPAEEPAPIEEPVEETAEPAEEAAVDEPIPYTELPEEPAPADEAAEAEAGEEVAAAEDQTPARSGSSLSQKRRKNRKKHR